MKSTEFLGVIKGWPEENPFKEPETVIWDCRPETNEKVGEGEGKVREILGSRTMYDKGL